MEEEGARQSDTQSTPLTRAASIGPARYTKGEIWSWAGDSLYTIAPGENKC
jgi:hypothetical protein